MDDTHEEGNGNGNANARRPGSGKYPGKGTHPPASEIFVNCPLSHTISPPSNVDDSEIGDLLLNDVESWNSHDNQQNVFYAVIW